MKSIFTNLKVMFVFGLIFIFNKFLFRPYVLESKLGDPFETIVLSIPNLCEAVIGTLCLINIAIYFIEKIKEKYKFQPNYSIVYFSIVVLAGMYVVLQEFKIHNLGGKNTYDKNDVIFSVVGILLSSVYIFITKPRFSES